MLDCNAQSHSTTQRETHDRGTLELQVGDKRSDVVGHRFETHRPVDGRRAAVGLEIHADDAMSSRKRLEIGPEHLN